MCTLRENLDSANKFNNMTCYDVNLRHCVNPVMPASWK